MDRMTGSEYPDYDLIQGLQDEVTSLEVRERELAGEAEPEPEPVVPTPVVEPSQEPQSGEAELQRRELQEAKKALAQQQQALKNLPDDADPDTVAQLKLDMSKLASRIIEREAELIGAGGTTLYSDPFTASIVEGGKLIKGASKWVINRIKADYSIPQSPTGGIDPNIAREKMSSKVVSPGMRAAYDGVRRFFAAGMTELNSMGLGNAAREVEKNLQLDSS